MGKLFTAGRCLMVFAPIPVTVGFVVGHFAGPVGGLALTIVGGVISVGCTLIGLSLCAYDLYQTWQQKNHEHNNLLSNSNQVIHNYTNDNRINLSPVITNNIQPDNPEPKNVSLLDSFYDTINSLFPANVTTEETTASSTNTLTYIR